jgi:hypothetical protein
MSNQNAANKKSNTFNFKNNPIILIWKFTRKKKKKEFK